MEKIIAANHKMNMTKKDIDILISKLHKTSFKPIIFPTSIYAPFFINENIDIGLQNIYYKNKGSYTGEISPMQAKELGINYVLIGHYERRELFNETNDIINKKIKKALENDLKVILCISDINDYQKELSLQIKEGLKDINKEIIIAYEPVKSIGTNKALSKEKIIEIVNFIKKHFTYDVKVLYGGSVNKENAKKLKDIDELSGFLVSTASLNTNEFINIGEVLS